MLIETFFNRDRKHIPKSQTLRFCIFLILGFILHIPAALFLHGDDPEVLPNYYELVLDVISWEEAVEICESRGGNLATITSDAEWQQILSQLGDSLNGKNIWLGGRRVSQDNTDWMWVTGENWGAPRDGYHRWRSSEPDGHWGQQDRLFINGAHSRDGPNLQWNDHPNEPVSTFSSHNLNGYLAEFGWARMSGEVVYEGSKEGNIVILLTGGPDDQPGGTIELDAEGEFSFPHVVKGWEYTMTAFIDENGDGLKERAEPSGKFILSPHLLIEDVDEILIKIFDQNLPPNKIELSSFNIPENAPIHTTIGQVSAEDPDPGNEPFVYVIDPKDKFLVRDNKLITTTTFIQADTPNPTVTLRAVDEGGLTLEKTFELRVITGNQAPTISSIESSTLNEDDNLDLTQAIIITDDAANSEQVMVTLAVPKGTIHIHDTRGLEFIEGSNASGFMKISAALSVLRSKLSRLIYSPDENFNGSLKMTLLINDLGNPGGDIEKALVDLHTISITVTPTNDAPEIHLPETEISLDENSLVLMSTFTDNGITLEDDPENDEQLELQISTKDGNITLGSLSGITLLEGDGVEDGTIRAKGTILALNLALNGLIYKPDTGFSGDTSISLSLNDLGNSGVGEVNITEASLPLNIIAHNDPPAIVAPVEVSLNEDSTLTLSTANDNAIVVHDDAIFNDGDIEVELTVDHGILSLENPVGLEFPEGDSQGDILMRIVGKFSILSDRLQNLNYTPDKDFNGKDNLVIKINDKGNHGIGGEKTTAHTISLNVIPQNDPPFDIQLSANAAQEGKANIQIGTLSASDIDPNESHTFSLKTGGNHFSINGNTLSTKTELSFQQQPVHSIIIIATDQGGATLEKTFVIRVLNSNDAPTKILLSADPTPENLPAGTIVGKLTTEDADGSLGGGLIGYWPFDEAAGLLTGDVTENHNHGNLQNLGDNPWESGKYASAISFNGQGFVEIPHIGKYLVDQGTISLWYKFDSSNGTLFSKDADGKVTGGHVYLRMKDRFLESRIQSITTDHNIKAANNSDNAAFQWHHVALQFGDQGHRLYLDGKVIATNSTYKGGLGETTGGVGNQEPIAIGANTSQSRSLSTQPTAEHFNGLVDDVRIYNRVLTDEEVGELTVAQFPSYDHHTYEILSSANPKFFVDGDTIKLLEPLDFEESQTHTIRVKSTDSGGLSHTETITINVLDANDPPTDMQLVGNTIAENLDAGTKVGTFSATDPDSSSTDSIRVGHWAFSHLPHEGRTSDYYPENIRDFANAHFKKYIEDTDFLIHSQINPDDAIETGYYIFETWIESSADTSFPITVWGADGHSLFVDDEFLVGGGFGARESGSIDLKANEPRKITAVVYQARSVVFIHVTSSLKKISDTAGLSISSGGNRHIYKLVDGEGSINNEFYAIENGELFTARPFDFESTNTHSIRVQVNDSGQTFEKTFTIKVTDANDPPTGFTPLSFTVAENAIDGTSIGTLTALDVDQGDKHTFALVTPADDGPTTPFIISNNELKLSGSLDFENQSTYTLLIKVFDEDVDSAHTSEVVISVTNVNEAPTGLTLQPSTVKENQNPRTIVGNLTASDPDQSDTSHTFKIADEAFLEDFLIEGNQLRTSRPLDFESTPVITIPIETKDEGGLTFTQNIEVSVQNLNEPPTNILLSKDTVKENQPVGTQVGSFSTVDPDVIPNSDPTQQVAVTDSFKLVEGEGSKDNAKFVIEGNILRTATSLDFETQAEHSIHVMATDSGGLSYTRLMIIKAEDAGDTPTGIELDNSSVDENKPKGTLVGNLATVDQDAVDSFTYELLSSDPAAGAGVGNDSALFTIDTNKLKTAEPFDYETQKTYTISVKVTDSNQLSFTQNLEITVSAVNEAPEGLTLIPGSVLENSPENTTAGTLIGIDPDLGDRHSFKIIGGKNEKDFQIKDKELIALKRFDFETQPSLELILEVMDSGGLTSEHTLNITVINSNDPPTDITLDKTTFPENLETGTILAKLTAIDSDPIIDHDDNAPPPFTFSLVEGVGDEDNDRYAIEGDQLLVGAVHNFEEQAEHSIRIKVQDSDGLTFEKSFQLTITDAPDAPTQIKISDYSVPENGNVGIVVGTLTTTDEDAAEKHVYSLSEEETNFTLRNNTLYTAATFDFETTSSHTVSITTTDKTSLTFTQEIEILITDENDPPTGVSLDQDKISEGLPAKTEVGTLVAIDPDQTDTHRYSIIGGQPAGYFFINGDKLLTSRVLDRETTPEISVRIRATDASKAIVDQTFLITIVDVNDAPTNIILDNTIVEENLPTGSLVGNLSLIDPDIDANPSNNPQDDGNDSLPFELVDGPGASENEWFQIEGSQLQIATPLNFEVKPRYRIRIKAVDSGGLSVERNFLITATDVAEAPTQIKISRNTLAENMPRGTTIGTLSAVDDDAFENHSFFMGKVAADVPNDNKLFIIRNNVLFSNAVFDFDEQTERIIYVMARDKTKNTFTQPITIQITDANDPPTAISIDNNIVPENQPKGTLIGLLSAEDPDLNENHRFFVVGGKDSKSFIARGNQLFTNRTFDFETEKDLEVIIRVIDSGKESFEAPLIINLADTPDAPVGIVIDNDSIPESDPLGSTVGILSIIDPDAETQEEDHSDEPNHLLNNRVIGHQSQANLGLSSAVFGNIIAVGAPNENINEHSNAGAVYLYKISEAGELSEPVKLTATETEKDQKFGFALNLHENVLLVGAPGQDAGSQNGAGAVHIFTINPETLEANEESIYTEPRANEDDAFGFAIQRLGNLVAVGAPDTDTNQIKYSGAVYTYALLPNHTLEFKQHLTSPVPARSESYGMDIALSATKVVVSANRASPQRVTAAGAVHLYRYNAEGMLEHKEEIISPDINKGDSFGNSIAMTEDLLCVGVHFYAANDIEESGAVYLFDIRDEQSIYLDKIVKANPAKDDFFGENLAIYDDLLLISSKNAEDGEVEDVGSVEVYRIENSSRARFIMEYKMPEPIAGSFLGSSLAIGSEWMVFGAEDTHVAEERNAGAFYVKRTLGPDPFSLVSGFGDNDNEYFSIVWDELKVIKPLNFEVQQEYKIRVRGVDNTELSVEQPLIIYAIDSPEPATRITIDQNSIAENLKAGAPVGILSAEDEDAFEKHTFRLVDHPNGESTDNEHFTLKNTSLRTRAILDYETKSEYTIYVQVSDRQGETYSQFLTIYVENENDPPSGLSIDNDTVLENQPRFTTIGNLIGEDPDPRERFIYQIVGGLDLKLLTLKGTLLRTNEPFDHETKPELNIIVRVTDSKKASQDFPLTIKVADANDPPSALTIDSASIDENSGEDALVGTFMPDDVDNEFRIGDRFTYVKKTRATWDVAKADAEEQGGYLATFTSREEWDSMLESVGFDTIKGKVLWLGGTDERVEGKWEWITGEPWVWEYWNDEQPNQDDQVNPRTGEVNPENYLHTQGKLSPELKWNDNVRDALMEGYILENPVFTFSLAPGVGDVDNKFFRLEQNELRMRQSANFEDRDEYSIRVEVTDPFGATLQEVFEITINDVNEPPFPPVLDNNIIKENTPVNEIIGRFTLEDPDFRDLAIAELAEDTEEIDNELFSVKKNLILSLASFDHEEKDVRIIRLKTSDKHGNSTISDHEIIIEDVNEPPTGITVSNDEVAENTNPGETLTVLTPVDPDDGDTFIFSLVAGIGDSDNHLFVLDAKTGELSVANDAILNYEEKLEVSIRAKVQDSVGNEFVSNLFLQVSDQNEAPYSIELDSLNLMEGLSRGTHASNIIVKDEDAGDTYTVSLAEGAGDDHNSYFQIKNGALLVNKTILLKNLPELSIRIKAVDKSGLSAEEIFSIQVTDAPDAPESISLEGTKLKKFEPSGTFIGTLSTSDIDIGDTHSFALTTPNRNNSNELFYIEGDQLLSNHVFDDSSSAKYTINVEVTDSSGLTTTENLDISIIDAEKPSGFFVNITRNPPEGGLVTGAGYYQKGEFALLEVKGAQGYQFAGHSGDVPGGFSATNPLELTVETELNITTNFTPGFYKVDVGVYPPQHGYAWGGGNVLEGTEITITAEELDPSYGAVLTHWTVNNEIIALNDKTPLELKLTINEAVEVLAHFNYGLHETMTHIPSGTFIQGNDRYRVGPSLEPYINAFYLDKYETTKELWYEVYNWAVRNGYQFSYLPDEPQGRNMSHTDRAYKDDFPITGIHWYDAVKWLNARSEKAGLSPVYYKDAEKTEVYRTGGLETEFEPTNDMVDWDAKGYRLPTESEWEKAARGGVEGLLYPNGNTINTADVHYSSKSVTRDIKSVGEPRPPNGYGLYDMSGNAWEMCWDWYWKNYYKHNYDLQVADPDFILANPVGPYIEQVGKDNWHVRVVRGGSGNSDKYQTRVYYRKDSHKTWMQYATTVRSAVPAPNEPYVELDVTAIPAHLGTAKGSGTYKVDTQVTLEATDVDDLSRFLRWEDADGNILGNSATQTITLSANQQAIAVFEDLSPPDEQLYSLQLTANPSEAGQVFGGGAFIRGTVVTISAIPTGNNQFAGWAGDASGLEPTLQVTLDSHKTVVGYFGDTSIDSDNDGLSDLYERFIGANPFLADSDGDSITDADEVNVFSSDPANADSDKDGYDDRTELYHNTSLTDPNDFPFIPEDGLVRHFQFRGKPYDTSRNRVSATGTGYSNVVDRHEQGKSAYYFDGKDALLTVSKFLGFQRSSARSISGWIKQDEPFDGGIIGWGRTEESFLINVKSGIITVEAGNDVITGSTKVDDRNWHHFLVILPEGGTVGDLEIWIDGVKETVTIEGNPDEVMNTVSRADATIGFTKFGLFKGTLDDFRLYDRALVQTEVEKLYELERPKPPDSLRPTITKHPESLTIAEGGTAVFTVEAKGIPEPTYTWQKVQGRGWISIRGNNSPTLSMTSIGVEDSTKVRVTVSNASGYAKTKIAVLSVLEVPSFVTPPTDINFIDGKGGFLDLDVSGTPRLTYEWFKGEESLGVSYSNRFKLPKGSTQETHGGSYSVKVMNAVGEITSEPFNITFIDPVTIVDHPQDTGIVNNGTGSISVTAEGGGTITYQWQKYDTRSRKWLDVHNGVLAELPFENMNVNEEGMYQCVVSNGPSSVTSVKATVSMYIPPTIRTHPRDIQINENANATFSALGLGTPDPGYQWQKYDSDLGIWNDLTNMTSDSLLLKKVQKSDAGKYRAVISNPGGTVISNEAELTVYYLPSFTQNLEHTSVNEDGSTTFTVEADALDRRGDSVTYSWFFNNSALSDRNGVTGTRTNSITIDPVTMDHGGIYHCEVRNSVGTTKSSSAKLTVLQKPYLIKGSGDMTLPAGKTVNIYAIIRGAAPLTFSWQKDGEDIEGVTLSKVSLRGVTVEDSGTYTLTAANPAGELSISYTLTVQAASTTTPPRITLDKTDALSPLLDSDGDGLNNLLEHALGSDPTNGNSAFEPIVDLIEGPDGSTFLSLSYTQNHQASGLTYVIETSTDLSNWQPVDLSNASASKLNRGTYTEVTHYFEQIVDQTFFRIRVEK